MGCDCSREREVLVSKRESALSYISDLGYDRVYFDQGLLALGSFQKENINFSELMAFLQQSGMSTKLIDYPNSPLATFYQHLSRDQGYSVRTLSLIVILECQGTPTHKATHLHALYSKEGVLTRPALGKLISKACKIAFSRTPLFAKLTAQRVNDPVSVTDIAKYMDRLESARDSAIQALVSLSTTATLDAESFATLAATTDLKCITSSKALREYAVNLSFGGRLTENTVSNVNKA